MNEIRHGYREMAPPHNHLALEGVIRALCGEEHLIDEISAEGQFRVQLPAIVRIVHQSYEVQERLDGYLSDAEILAAQWQGEG